MNRNTPGLAGYVLGVLVGLSVLVAPVVVLFFISPDLFLGYFLANVVALVTVAGVPVAVLGVCVLHMALRHEDRQGVHVTGAAILGAIGAFLCVEAIGWGILLAATVGVWAGFASAAGRAVVSPRG